MAAACVDTQQSSAIPSLAEEGKTKPLTSHSEVHVLAVDDSVVDRKVIENLLKISAFKVTSVDSGIKALDFLGIGATPSAQEINISMIITDYCMPGMTGYELLKRVKSSLLKEIPFVVMSSENIPTRIQSCLAEGAKEFIMKPVRLADVKRLKAHIKHPNLSLLEAIPASSNKRKFSSGDQSFARRPRLSGVTASR